jgi:hypothetical protein
MAGIGFCKKTIPRILILAFASTFSVLKSAIGQDLRAQYSF